MKPIKFKDQNCVFGKKQSQYKPLPALMIFGDSYGTVITCWKMSWRERVRTLITGKVWVSEATFNKGVTPLILETEAKRLYSIEEGGEK